MLQPQPIISTQRNGIVIFIMAKEIMLRHTDQKPGLWFCFYCQQEILFADDDRAKLHAENHWGKKVEPIVTIESIMRIEGQ